MKIVLFIFMLLLVSCANTKNEKKEPYVSKIDFEVPAGEYEQFQLSTWDVGTNECIEFSLIKPENSTKWLASVMLYIAGEQKKDLSKIFLFTEHKDSKSLSLAFTGGNRENKIFESNIKFGEAVKFKATFPNDHTIQIKIDSSEFTFPVDYKIQKLLVGASSAKATVKLFDSLACNK